MKTIKNESERNALIERIKRLSGNESALWGRMNVNQMVCHVADQLRVSLGDLGQPDKKADLFGRTVIKFLVLYVIAIPKNVPTSPKIDQAEGKGTQPTNFEADRKISARGLEARIRPLPFHRHR